MRRRGARRDQASSRAAAALSTLAALAVAPAAMALDPGKAPGQYVHDAWGVEQGLPQNAVQALAQTRDGYLWIGTEEGLVRFDGVRFTVFDKANTSELKDNCVRALLAARDGSLWIGMLSGLLQWKDGRLSMHAEHGLAEQRVEALFEAEDGTLWIGTRGGGLFRRTVDGAVSAFTRRDGLTSESITAIGADRSGQLWVGTRDAGLNRLVQGRFEAFTERDSPAHRSISAIYEDREGVLWIGTNGAGLDRLSGDELTVLGKADGLPGDDITAFVEDRDGNLWIGTRAGGVARIRDGAATTYAPQDGLTNGSILVLLEDREGSLWIGTNGGGLNRLRDGKVTAYPPLRGASPGVWTIHEGHDGTLWLGTDGSGLLRLRGGSLDPAGALDGQTNDRVFSVFEDSAGSLWAGTMRGLSRLRAGQWTTFGRKDGLPAGSVYAISEDAAGAVWFGTSGGLGRIVDSARGGGPGGPEIEVFGPDHGMPREAVRALSPARQGGMWIGSEAGLFRFKDGAFQGFSPKDGLSALIVSSIYEEADGTVWIGTYGGGLDRYKDGRFAAITVRQGLFDDVVSQILDDRRGNLWMSSAKGISRVRKSELHAVADGVASSVTHAAYGTSDGMLSRECNGGIQPAGWVSRDGRLWFPTTKGAVMIDPARIPENPLPPPVVVERVLVNRRVAPSGGEIEVPPGSKDIAIEYAALSFIAPEKVRFKYRLEGFDDGWVDAGARRAAYYTGVAPGRYRFQVLACNSDGRWNETGASVLFRVEPRLYETYPFYAGLGLAVALLAFGAHRVRLRHLQLRALDLEQRVAERTAELAKAHHHLSDAMDQIQQDLSAARAFQRRLLPPPPASRELAFAALYRPVDVVGGDIYDIAEIAAGRFRVFLADATGHGVQGALRTMVLRTEYDRLRQRQGSPDALLSELSDKVATSFPDMEMRCTACCFDLEIQPEGGAIVRLASAAHPGLLLASADEVREIRAPGAYLGVVTGVELGLVELRIEPGDRLLAYTDGLVEQENTAREAFEVERVSEVLRSRALSLGEVLDALDRDLDAFAGGAPRMDDVTLIGVECLAR